MRVLVTTWIDASNLSIENIVKELVTRGHQVEIYAFHMDPKSIRMFVGLNVPIHPVKELNPKKIRKFDIAFTAESAMSTLKFADIYTFSYNNLPDTLVTGGSDFMFTMVKDRNLRWNEDCATMPVGVAKNDVPKICDRPKKQFLYIDAGHNPFGESAKLKLANMLLDVCRNFPEYRLVVKPRWLPNDKNQAHRSALHIYEVLRQAANGVLPDNLVLLNEHRNLQELLDESVSVITTSVSCYLDAAVRDKGCIVVDGLGGENTFDTRATLHNIYSSARESGCCVSYQDVTRHLPNGILCDPAHLKKRIAYKYGVSKKIVDVMEYIFENCLKKGKYPAIQEYDYSSYREILASAPGVSFQELKQKRMKNGPMRTLQQFEFPDVDVDFSPAFELLERSYRTYPTNASGLRALIKEIELEKQRLYIENKDKFMSDDINQAILFQVLAEAQQEDDILNIPQEEILCPGPYHYHLGMIYSRRKAPLTAIEHFCVFLKETNSKTFDKYPQESTWGIRNVYSYLFNVYDGENIPPDEFIDLYISFYEQRDIGIVAYNSRKRAHNWLPNVAEQLADIDPERALKCLQLYAKWEYHYNVRERDEQLRKIRGAKLYRFGEKIKWFVRKLKGGICCLHENGLKYTIVRAKEHIYHFVQKSAIWKKISNFAPWKIHRSFSKQILAGYRTYAAIVEQHGNDTFIHIAANGNGDVYLTLKYYASYIEKYFSDKDNVLVSSSNSFTSLTKWFRTKGVEKLSNEQWMNLIHLFVFLKGARIDVLHHHIYVRHTGILTPLEGIHGLNFMDFFESVVFDQLAPTVPQLFGSLSELEEIFDGNRLEVGKTVVLSPYANNVPPIQEEYWIRLVDRLKVMGISVCTNAFGAQPPIFGTPKVELPFCKFERFLDMAGYLVSRRSGFDDIIHSSSCRRVEVYPERIYKRSLVATTAECFSYTANPISVGKDNVDDCVEETLRQLGLSEGIIE